MKLFTIFALLALPLAAQQTVNISITLDAPTVTAINTYRTQQTQSNTILTGSLDASATQVPLANATGISTGTHFMIDAEEFAATGPGVANVVPVTRASVGTTAAAHSAQTTVRVLRFPTSTVMAKAFLMDRVKMILNDFPNSTIATQLAAKATADAAIAAAIASAVQ